MGLQSMEVKGLFGNLRHRIVTTPDSRITILAGPNGSGKTHVLRLAHAILAFDLIEVTSVPFAVCVAKFDNGTILNIQRVRTGEEISLHIRGTHRRQKIGSLTFSKDDLAQFDSKEIPPYLSRLPDGAWFDERMGKAISRRVVEIRYGLTNVELIRRNILKKHPWLSSVLSEPNPTFIDTRRLDQPSPRLREDGEQLMRSAAPGKLSTERISRYMNQVKAQIDIARRESLSRSQQSDQMFPAKLLEKSRVTVKERELRDRYQLLSELDSEFQQSGLTTRAVRVEFPETSVNPTERRILNVFLDDWDYKLQPLQPVNQKLQSLLAVINGKLSRKKMIIETTGTVKFSVSEADGDDISVEDLSSGEQHLLAIFTLVLFSAEPGSVVFIDEPEISLHAAWKHSFIDDIESVAELNNLSVIVATHSSAIVNGRWDLVQELTDEPAEL